MNHLSTISKHPRASKCGIKIDKDLETQGKLLVKKLEFYYQARNHVLVNKVELEEIMRKNNRSKQKKSLDKTLPRDFLKS